MRRRDLLKMTAAAITLSAPHIGRAEHAQPLKFVPIIGLALLDPTFAAIPQTRSHAYLVFDTLYGLDEAFMARPQMVEGDTVDAAGTLWELRLREQLRFHDGTPVLSRDAVASIRRCAQRDGFCQALMDAADELTAPDDRTIRFRLKRPFPRLREALAGLAPFTPVIMPERLASADPFHPVTEMVGSGPYRFVGSDFVMAERAAYERFAGYTPCDEGKPSYTAGPKLAYIERVEWSTIDDAATATAALLHGEVDWLQAINPDQIPLIARNPAVRAEVTEPAGSIGIMRFNQLHPPFNDPRIRRALLGAIDQADAMNALAGVDRHYWRDHIGLFHNGTPFANDAGIDVLSGPRDYDKVKRELAQAGYEGERIVVLGTSGTGYIPALSQVGADTLRRAGMNVDLQLTDFATMARRMLKMDPPDKGGWNVYFGIAEGAFNHTLATNQYIRGDGKSGAAGWPLSPGLEESRQAWLDAGDLDEQKRIAVAAQCQLWLDVPYIPMGQWLRVTAYRRNLVGMPHGFAAFYGVRREG